MNLFLYIGLVVLVLLAGLITAWFKPKTNRSVKLLLAFSGAYLLGITFLHLLPEVYQELQYKAGFYILAGFFLQLILEFFSKGIEHGHIHREDQDKGSFPLAIFVSLCVHAFFEGMPIHSHGHHIDGHSHDNQLILGVILHKIPVAIVLMSLLLQSGLSVFRATLWLAVFTLMMPLGTLVNHLLGSGVIEDFHSFNSKMLGVVLGILLHVSTTILFESSENHRFTGIKLLVILCGVMLAFISLY